LEKSDEPRGETDNAEFAEGAEIAEKKRQE